MPLLSARFPSVSALVVGLLCATAACSPGTTTLPAIESSPPPGAATPLATTSANTIVLLSIDGFRWDYMEKAPTPNLDRMAAAGVRAEYLIPSFPTKTFPNHYTIVTGLYPEHHGIIANDMWDDGFQARFALSLTEEVENPRWWGGEPIWVTAERQGLRTASYFWPGSTTPIGGVLPTYTYSYDGSVPNEERVRQVIQWLTLPDGERPSFATTYFSLLDDVGHNFGPDAPETAVVITEADRLVGLLLDGIDSIGQTDLVNVIVVSDHGMVQLSRDSVVFLDDYLDMSRVRVVDWAPALALTPDPDYLEEALAALQEVPRGMSTYRREEVPERFHFRDHARITPLVGILAEGWSATSREYFDSTPNAYTWATHGFDNAVQSMQAFFLASGPAFRQGVTVGPFENIHLYELMAEVLGVEPAPNDGDLEAVRHVLRATGSGGN